MTFRNSCIRNIWVPAALLGVFGAAALAQAAPGPSLPIIGGPNSISAGVFLPSGAAKVGGATQLAVEFRYGLPIPQPSPTRTVISLALETGSQNGSRSTIIPVTIGEEFDLGSGLYVGAGTGYYFLNQHDNGSVTSQLSTTQRTGGYGEIGYRALGVAFVSAKYQFVERADGIMVTAGLHF